MVTDHIVNIKDSKRVKKPQYVFKIITGITKNKVVEAVEKVLLPIMVSSKSFY